LKKSRRIAHQVLQAASKGEWEIWRKHYDSLSIDDLIFINTALDAHIRDQKCRAVGAVIEVLERLYLNGQRDIEVVELGCHRGYLADECLKHFPKMIKSWTGYDLNFYALGEPIPQNGRYTTVKQTEWFYNIEINHSMDTFISTSTLEHHNTEQVLKIFDKLGESQGIRNIIIALPVRPSGWQGYGGSHVLLMGVEEISEAIEKAGFEIFYFEKNPIFTWGASR